MDKRETLKSMLNNMINDKSEQAALDLHNYLTAKMRDVAGLSSGTTPELEPEDVDSQENSEQQ